MCIRDRYSTENHKKTILDDKNTSFVNDCAQFASPFNKKNVVPPDVESLNTQTTI